MKIENTSKHRFDIFGISDSGQQKNGKLVKGIAGYHGILENIMGRFLEIFNITVRIKGDNGTYYLNCVSLEKWFKRNKINQQPKIHDSSWIQETIDRFVKKKNTKQNPVLKKQIKADDDLNRQKMEEAQIKALDQALNIAISGDNVEKCEKLIADGAVDNFIKHSTLLSNPLETAIRNANNKKRDLEKRGSFEPGKQFVMCELLVKNAPELVNVRNSEKKLPLEDAIEKGDLEGVRWLIANKADLSLHPRNRESLFLLALDNLGSWENPNVREEICRLVMVTENDKQTLETVLKHNRLTRAIYTHRDIEEIKKIIIDEGFDISKKPILPELPHPLITALSIRLHHSDESYAIDDRKKRLEICTFLLDHGAANVLNQIVRDGNDGILPLNAAISSHDKDLVKLLIDYGADITLEGKWTLSLLGFAERASLIYTDKVELNGENLGAEHKAMVELLKPKHA